MKDNAVQKASYHFDYLEGAAFFKYYSSSAQNILLTISKLLLILYLLT